METFLEAFLPLFVAVNVIGTLPIFIGLTEGMPPAARRRLVVEAATTAFAVAVLILFAGELIFRTLGITLNDLRVGGGLILLILSIVDLIFADFRRRNPAAEEGGKASEVGIAGVVTTALATLALLHPKGSPYLVLAAAGLVFAALGAAGLAPR